MQEQVDEFTGVSSKVIIESKDPELRPRITVVDDAGDDESRELLLPVGAYLAVGEGEEVAAGDVVAKIPRESDARRRTSPAVCRAWPSSSRRASRRRRAIVTEIDGIGQLRPGLARQAPRDRDAGGRRAARST